MSRPAIVFIGFMGAGKSTALAAARAAGLQTTEIDELMEAAFGKPIRQAFEEDGEEAFRAREAEVVGELLERADGGAIALGGGSVLSERVRAAMARHVVVWLRVDPAEAWRRIARSDRPLARSEEDVRRLLETRLPLYEELADAVVPMGDRGIVERALPAIQALAGLPAGTRLLWATSASGEYPVLIGHGLLAAVSGLDWWPARGRRFCITDTNVGPLYAEQVGPLAAQVAIKPGELSKSLEDVAWVVDQLTESEMTRGDHVVSLGGGVVGDLAGFCAHIFQRGVPVVQVPTTLVAQVDSAYGGKTGVDTDLAKNYLGAYHQPAGVLADPGVLETLPTPELTSGFVEVLKTGLLAGGRLWERVRAIETLDPGGLDDVIFECARYKCDVVAADERDSGLREVLNLGHTVGHALEAAREYGFYRHGEAVGLGLLAALRLSEAPELREEVEAILARHGLPTEFEMEDTEFLFQMLDRDKKRTSAGVGFVLLSEPGRPRTGQILDRARVEDAVMELRRS